MVAFIFTLVVGVYRGIDYFLFENPSFMVNEISYSTDGNLGKRRVLDCLGLRPGENILRLDLDEMRGKILADLPRVREVHIIRDIPDRISFDIKERFAVAWLGNPLRLQSPQRCLGGLLVGSDGVVIRCEMFEQGYEALPVIFPEEKITLLPGSMVESVALTKGLEIVLCCEKIFKNSPVKLKSLRVSSPYSLVGYLNTGTEVIFGLEAIDRQISNLKVLLDEGTRRGEALATVNLLPKKNIPVRFTELEISGGAGPDVVPATPENKVSGREAVPRRVHRRVPRRAVTRGRVNSEG
ncbi:MAG: FtsQ-type POTRA domain-containing protein [Verrucomicrobiaceae bacterium]|nr:FtsQ-type POTRA domain-containing protein [Verrucomicrobiaceae bacterium]